MPGEFWGEFLAPAVCSFTSDWQPVSKLISILWLTGPMSASCFKSMRKCHTQRFVDALSFKSSGLAVAVCVEVLCRPDSVYIQSLSLSASIQPFSLYPPLLPTCQASAQHALPSQESSFWNILGTSTWQPTWPSLDGVWTWYRKTGAAWEAKLSETFVDVNTRFTQQCVTSDNFWLYHPIQMVKPGVNGV